jgi:hypothetical protein
VLLMLRVQKTMSCFMPLLHCWLGSSAWCDLVTFGLLCSSLKVTNSIVWQAIYDPHMTTVTPPFCPSLVQKLCIKIRYLLAIEHYINIHQKKVWSFPFGAINHQLSWHSFELRTR